MPTEPTARTASLVAPDEEVPRYNAMRAELEAAGYRDVEHRTLRPGQRIRHRSEQFDSAYANGTGVVVAVMENANSSWSRSYNSPDIEVIVLKDKPLLPDHSRLCQLANYHVAEVSA